MEVAAGGVVSVEEAEVEAFGGEAVEEVVGALVAAVDTMKGLRKKSSVYSLASDLLEFCCFAISISLISVSALLVGSALVRLALFGSCFRRFHRMCLHFDVSVWVDCFSC